MKKFTLILLASLAIVALSATPTHAVKPQTPSKGGSGGGGSSASLLGNDVSYPQCNGSLPSGQAFGIVGVNGGVANTSNPCFSEQLFWAQMSSGATRQPKAMLYVNTANPGHAAAIWPSNNTVYGQQVLNPYGMCDGSEGAACAYIYGWTRAYEDATIRNVANPASYKWWLDVETANSWSDTDLAANAASLEGMTAYFTSIGARVGLYSTSYQWGIIVGDLQPESNLNGLDSWLAGARTQRGAQANCSNPPLTTSGHVTLTQFVSKNLDYDVSCI